MSEHVSQLTIDALAAGHLSADEARAARAHVDGCPRCRADLEAADLADVLARLSDDERIAVVRALPPELSSFRMSSSPSSILSSSATVPMSSMT